MGSKTPTTDALVSTAEAILSRTTALSAELARYSLTPPSDTSAGTRSGLWTHDAPVPVDALRTQVLGLTQQLDRLLHGPEGFLHELVSTNWELGGLYVLLEFGVLQRIPLTPTGAGAGAGDTTTTTIGVAELARQTGLPEEKLLRICRLAATAGILTEEREGWFGHTAVSELLVQDEGYRSFIRFQLYETRISSASLADSLRKPNPFWTGQAAFDYVWGEPMYDWHAKNPDKGARFAKAMASVSQGLDPGSVMITDWLGARIRGQEEADSAGNSLLLVEVAGKNGGLDATQVASQFPSVSYQRQDISSVLSAISVPTSNARVMPQAPWREEALAHKPGCRSLVFLLRSVLWNLSDAQVVEVLRSFIPAIQGELDTTARKISVDLLVCDLVSPAFGSFEPHVERAFRRRDVTLMTMHNVKQRTAAEWGALFFEASPYFQIEYSERCSSHSCRGFWEVHYMQRLENIPK